MRIVGSVESLWRYPVKSMRGEERDAIFAGFSGVYGDRLFAFRSSANPNGFPYFTLRDQRQMLRYRPLFRHPEKAVAPPNLAEAESIASGATPVYSDSVDLMVDVETPAGKTVAVDDPALIELLRDGTDEKHHLTLLRSDRALTDCRPLSLCAVQTAGKLAEESGIPIDKRRFRANIYLDLTNSNGFTEDTFVGHSLRIGSKVTLSVLQRDSRCMIITFDPDTGEKAPVLLKTVAQVHAGMAGVYAAVLVEGMVRKGDLVTLLA
jgi:MOSC domain-containing protein